MKQIKDIIWEGPNDRIVLSPGQGGRIIAWSHRGSANLVREPQQLEGGLLRTLFAEERYPGHSYCTAHLVVSQERVAAGWRAHLRHYWYAPNVFARLFGWEEKVCPRYLDGLLLDKVITFDADRSLLVVDLTISNLAGGLRQITPWVQNTVRECFDHGFVVRDGQREDYNPKGGWWSHHLVDGAQTMRMVQQTRDGQLSAVLGAHTGPLAGMCKYDPGDFGPEATTAMQELRYNPVRLPAGTCWQANYFVAIAEDYTRWAADSPAELYARTQPTAVTWNERDLLPTLAAWAVPEEQERGLMVMSFLDKLPFTAPGRFGPAHAIAGFHAGRGERPRATVALFALRNTPGVRVSLTGGTGWRVLDENGQPNRSPVDLPANELRHLIIEAPPGLRGKNRVALRIHSAAGEIAPLRVPADARIEPRHPYQFKQMAQYLDERFRREKLEFGGQTAREFWVWQKQLRKRYQQWMRDSVTGSCPLEPRLLERQVGPTCIRDKIAIQTEPGMWLPSYVIYPKKAPKKMPALILFHGSGPGKEAYSPDEEPALFLPQHGHDLMGMPYPLIQKMPCLVYVPDQRSQGEWGEWYSAGAARRAGYNPLAMRMWDHTRSIDYLCSRPDVDASRIGCFGSSGGGMATMYTAGIDERIRAGILSSMPPYLVNVPDQFFNDMWSDGQLDDGWAPFAVAPSITPNVAALTIPRPLWIMDGEKDNGLWEGDPKGLLTHALDKWQAARDEVKRLYQLAGAEDKFRESWFPGGHCAGMTVPNVVEWFGKWGFRNR